MSYFNSLDITNVIHLEEVGSTNEFIKGLKKTDKSSNSVVYTFNQTQGKGQLNKFWFSGKNENLSISFLFNFNALKVSDQFYLNIWISILIKNYLKTNYINQLVEIKWPNDIYVNGKKIAGILIQTFCQGKYIQQAIIGIGLNVNSIKFPQDIPNPISIHQLTGSPVLLQELSLNFIEFLQKRMNDFSIFKLKLLKRVYLESLYRLNQKQNFLIQGKEKEGVIQGTNEKGELIVQFDNDIQHFQLHDIKYLMR